MTVNMTISSPLTDIKGPAFYIRANKVNGAARTPYPSQVTPLKASLTHHHGMHIAPMAFEKKEIMP